MSKHLFSILSLLTLIFVSSCSSVHRTEFTSNDMDVAYVEGFSDVRFWLDTMTPELEEGIKERLDKEKSLPGDQLNWLMLSGGGEDGAFGAGVLNGLTDAGTRPDFIVVSGVSTGALTAPFAFLGPKKDKELKELYTTVSMDKLVVTQFLSGLLFGGDGLVDTGPLRELIAKSVDEKFLEEVVEEYNKGRWLFIITTNLDSQRPVLWDMGRIAKRGGPKAVELFHNVMLASASIPGAFPPVMIKSIANGKEIEEMHVDGGTTMQVMTMPVSDNLETQLLQHHNRKRNVYLIMNNRMDPTFTVVPRDTVSIATRGMSTLIKHHGIGSIGLYYNLTKDTKMGFNLAYIHSDFEEFPQEPFEQKYMQNLFDYGYQKAIKGKVWSPDVPSATEAIRHSKAE